MLYRLRKSLTVEYTKPRIGSVSSTQQTPSWVVTSENYNRIPRDTPKYGFH
jgi:hypothetical protein